jgi:hypothetical protein
MALENTNPLDPQNLKVDPFGVLVGHTWAEVGIILHHINTLGIKRFVEIGIHKGGLAALLVHTTKHIQDFHYWGVEIDGNLIDPSVKRLFDPLTNARLAITDAHDENCIQGVSRFIRTSREPAWIYCDGGDKIVDFWAYAPILRKGDYISAHDFDYPEGGYERAEIKYSDVQAVVENCDLVHIGFSRPYRIGMFKKIK